jgi:hypothetical protein
MLIDSRDRTSDNWSAEFIHRLELSVSDEQKVQIDGGLCSLDASTSGCCRSQWRSQPI